MPPSAPLLTPFARREESLPIDRDFTEVISRAVFQSRQRVELLHVGGQAPDHPVHLEFPESRYLDTLFVRKLPYHP